MAVLLAYNLQTNLKFLASSAPEIWPGPHNVEMSHVTLESLGSPITKLWMAVQNAENGVVMGHSKVMGNAAIPRSAYDFRYSTLIKKKLCVYLLPFSRYSRLFVESRRFWPTPLAFGVPIRVAPVKFRGDLWHQKTRIPTFSRFSRTPTCDKHTQTNRRTQAGG